MSSLGLSMSILLQSPRIFFRQLTWHTVRAAEFRLVWVLASGCCRPLSQKADKDRLTTLVTSPSFALFLLYARAVM
eukprot:3781639-Amphidinium_carterae.1